MRRLNSLSTIGCGALERARELTRDGRVTPSLGYVSVTRIIRPRRRLFLHLVELFGHASRERGWAEEILTSPVIYLDEFYLPLTIHFGWFYKNIYRNAKLTM